MDKSVGDLDAALDELVRVRQRQMDQDVAVGHFWYSKGRVGTREERPNRTVSVILELPRLKRDGWILDRILTVALEPSRCLSPG